MGTVLIPCHHIVVGSLPPHSHTFEIFHPQRTSDSNGRKFLQDTQTDVLGQTYLSRQMSF